LRIGHKHAITISQTPISSVLGMQLDEQRTFPLSVPLDVAIA
jgi:hypothetical protein